MKFFFEVPIIIGRPFLGTGSALVDMEKGQMKFRLNNEERTSNICWSLRQSGELHSLIVISYRVEESSELQIEESMGVEELAAIIMNFYADGIEKYVLLFVVLDRSNIRFKRKKF